LPSLSHEDTSGIESRCWKNYKNKENEKLEKGDFEGAFADYTAAATLSVLPLMRGTHKRLWEFCK